MRIALLLMSIVVMATAAIAGGTFESEVTEWQKNRVEKLNSDNYYLAISGLFWLNEGASSFGSGEDNDLVFNGDVPGRIGTFHLKMGAVSVKIADGVKVTHDDKPVTSMDLVNDLDGEQTILKLGEVTWYVIQRGDMIGIRVIDPNSHVLKSFEGVEFFDLDPAWRVSGTFDEYDPPKTLSLATEMGTNTEIESWGAVEFEKDGQTHRLDVASPPGSKSLWIIFADQTSGIETYGAGRYMYIDVPDENGNVVIDFNTSYNPPCAFSPYTTCAFPPEQNMLSVKVLAGEKAYAGDLKHSKNKK